MIDIANAWSAVRGWTIGKLPDPKLRAGQQNPAPTLIADFGVKLDLLEAAVSGDQSRSSALATVPTVFAADPLVLQSYARWCEGDGQEDADCELYLEFVASLVLHLRLEDQVDLLILTSIKASPPLGAQSGEPRPASGAPADAPARTPDEIIVSTTPAERSRPDLPAELNNELEAFLAFARQLPDLEPERPSSFSTVDDWPAADPVAGRQDGRLRQDGRRTSFISLHAYLDRVEERWFGPPERRRATA